MEHIPDETRAIKEIHRVLKPGCTLVVTVPRFWPEKICWLLSDEYFNANQGHIRIYKRNALINLIEKNTGATFFHYHHAHSLHSPYWWLKCFVGPTREDSFSVNLYKRFLTWDIMKKPWLTKSGNPDTCFGRFDTLLSFGLNCKNCDISIFYLRKSVLRV